MFVISIKHVTLTVIVLTKFDCKLHYLNNKYFFKSLSYTSTFYNGIDATERREMWLSRKCSIAGAKPRSSRTEVFCPISCATATNSPLILTEQHFLLF